eukprot:CAMPEP_0113469716 /NCGR_PEP_ID=MMETSP0014_2-20120614/16048_1 /TAXON_ID=2857 /ORGANISM="Nitzschia sp." /LENGTH=239 /DNA_ID=CAMNT_0000362213 /DNA_START=137 /DNA_END=856 /DNA_ORIENTATION=+ /assembly_acc=CAM_ASM_000159
MMLAVVVPSSSKKVAVSAVVVRVVVVAAVTLLCTSSISSGVVVAAAAAGGGGDSDAVGPEVDPQNPNRPPYFTKEGYGVDVFECDNELIPLMERQKKVPGQTYRICYKPNYAAFSADVGIEKVTDWYWDTTYDGGVAEMQAVQDGQGDGVLSDVQCKPDGTICRLDTMLPSKFHRNPGSVVGEGVVRLTTGQRVFTHRDMFVGDFKFSMPELSEEQMAELQKQYEEQQAAGGDTGGEEL